MIADIAPTRPALRYHGGKWKLAPWIISHLPEHRTYVEPYGGGASVLLRKPRSYAEVYNEKAGQVVNLFQVYRDHGAELRRRVAATPFARDEYALAYEQSDDPIERARRTLVRSYMGFGSNAINPRIKSGFRANSNRSGTTPAHDWANFPAAMDAIISRLQGVVIENRPAHIVMRSHDSPATLHYVDPPYVHETRADSANKGYEYEMTLADHAAMIVRLLKLIGMVAVSGYRHPLYDDTLLPLGWTRVDRKAYADGAQERVESLWLSPNSSDGVISLWHGKGGA